MQTMKRRRLSADAWSAMVEKFEASGLSEEAFCRKRLNNRILARIGSA